MTMLVRTDLCGLGGQSVDDTFSLSGAKGPGDLYVAGAGDKFCLLHREKGTAYGESCETEQTIRWEGNLKGELGLSFQLTAAATEKWGINFPGQLVVSHKDGTSLTIYLPGVRSYDPTGRTGDAHASERIGPSCAKFQTTVTVCELAAVLKGASQAQLTEIQAGFDPAMRRYHGRVGLFQWMHRQIEDAAFNKKEVTPYPDYVKEMSKLGTIDLSAENHEHTRLYLESYEKGQPVPPPHYFRKVQVKDKLEDVIKSEDMDKFKSMLG